MHHLPAHQAGVGNNRQSFIRTTQFILLDRAGMHLREQKKTFYNIYYHAIKKYNGKELSTHIVASTLPEDPDNVHISFRNFDKPNTRRGVEEDIGKAEAILWADGRKVKGE